MKEAQFVKKKHFTAEDAEDAEKRQRTVKPDDGWQTTDDSKILED